MASTDTPPLLQRPLYLFDLPQELLSTITLRSQPHEAPTPDASSAEKPSTPENGASTPDSERSPSKGFSCNLCRMSFESLQEQRSHHRSDLHNYNLKQRMRGVATVDEQNFEKLIGDLDESLSGSDSSESESEADDAKSGNLLPALLKRQAKISDKAQDDEGTVGSRRGGGGSPFIWFSSSRLPSQYSIGVYKSLFSQADQDDPSHVAELIKQKQLDPIKPAPQVKQTDSNVPTVTPTQAGPHYFLCMIGGGHFAAMIIALAPKIGVRQDAADGSRQAVVLAHKTFHRYTTRRKQGGSQSSYDTANGPASSAGSALRRYNEQALTVDIRSLLKDWKALIDTSELLFVRATGSVNRNTLYGDYEGRVMKHNDSRIRSYPFSTRRATQKELMRAFVELTRVKWTVIDEAAIAAKAAEDEKARIQAATLEASKKSTAKAPKLSEEEEQALLHTTQIQSFIKRSKAPALLSYLTSNKVSADFQFQPAAQNHHAPTPLHMAATTSSPAIITALLTKANANPTIRSQEGRTPYEICGDRPSRDAFRLARHTLGESAWPWDGAGVLSPLTPAEATARDEAEKQEAAKESAAEAERRKAELEKLRADEKGREDSRREKKFGKGQVVTGLEKSVADKREEEARGMTPEMRARLERERRARAAEERMKRL